MPTLNSVELKPTNKATNHIMQIICFYLFTYAFGKQGCEIHYYLFSAVVSTQ